jgi:hypothetical protein
MRIELPDWTDRYHAQEDAHTLTLSLQLVQRAPAVDPVPAAYPASERVSTVVVVAPPSLTLTL